MCMRVKFLLLTIVTSVGNGVVNGHMENTELKFVLITILAILLTGCSSKESIKIPFKNPLPHRSLYRMGSTPLERVGKEIRFGNSKKYQKKGVTVILLKGSPYEVGYARGILLKNEIGNWVRDRLARIKTKSIGTSIGRKWMISRAKEVEQFIPVELKEELNGLSAGSQINYDLILMLNLLETIAHEFGCTSVTVRASDGRMLRSHNQDGSKGNYMGPWTLAIYRPTKGYGFASVCPPGFIGVWTAMNEKKLTFGTHNISGAKIRNSWRGLSTALLNRRIIQYSSTVEEAGETLGQYLRSLPRMFMVASPNNARIYEYDSKHIRFKIMASDYLVLTNHTHMLSWGHEYPHSAVRYDQAKYYLDRNRNKMDLNKLVELNRLDNISWAYHEHVANLNSTIFRPETLDFWVAVDPPPATRRKWVGFNLEKELDGRGDNPDPLVIPATDVTKHRFY